MAYERQIGEATDREARKSEAQALLQKIAAAETSGDLKKRDELLAEYHQYEDLDLAA